MTNLLYSAKHYQTKCAETLDSVINYANIATEILNDAKNTAKSAAFGNIGDIKYTIRKDVPNGGFWCDGSVKTKQDLPNIYQMLLDNKFQYVTITEYEQILAEKGSCGFFGLDITNECFKLPLLNDIFIKTGQEAEVFGAESLPNITGNIRVVNDYNFDNTSIDGVINGAFEVNDFPALTGATINQNTTVTNDGVWNVSINASRSSSTYQNGAKVNPDHVKYRAYIILFSGEKELSIVNWTNSLQKTTEDGIKLIDQKADSYLDKTQITNCIIEIPQDIKLELIDGTLTLKTGSKIYVPNGVGKFDEIIIASDINGGQAGTGSDVFYLVTPNRGGIASVTLSNIYSGSTQPTGTTYAVWYDTTNNRIGLRGSGSSTFTFGYSFPICVGTIANNLVTSIDQVFNGFGYIGSTLFALPGVKGLIPNSRNADGSLKNEEYIISKIVIRTFTSSDTYKHAVWGIGNDGNISRIPSHNYSYNEIINKNMDLNGEWNVFKCGSMTITSGVISNFNSNYTFRAVNYNDKEEITDYGMPDYDSGIAISASGYTAPSNGWILSNIYSDWGTSSANGRLLINDIIVSANYHSAGDAGKGHNNIFIVPISKGDVVTYKANVSDVIFYPCRGVN